VKTWLDSFERKSGRNAKMRYPCAKCDKEIEKQQGYEHQGKLFCEDCYMDVLSPPKACDPWAVHSAQTFLKGKDKLATLTPLQLRLVNYLKQKGEATLEELIKNLNLTEEELKREFAVLRHMEILRATKRGDRIHYLLF
jgi:DNA-directed RNA polymerase subunit RPC12/RpoP